MEGHTAIAAVLAGVRNRQWSDLHAAFATGTAEAQAQVKGVNEFVR